MQVFKDKERRSFDITTIKQKHENEFEIYDITDLFKLLKGKYIL